MTILFYVLTGLLCVLTLLPAVLKLTGAESMREGAEKFGIPWPRYELIGLLEVAAAVGLTLGLVWQPIGVAAAMGFAALMIGATFYHVRAKDKAMDTIGAIVGLVVSIAYVIVAAAEPLNR